MNSMPFRQLKSFFKILIGVQYDIFIIRSIQCRQEQNIANMEDIYIQLVPVDMLLTIVGIGSGMLEEGAFLSLIVTHDRCKGSVAISAYH